MKTIDIPPVNTTSYYWLSQKEEIIVINNNGEISIFSSICPHMGGKLEYDKKNKKLFCPWHGLEIDITDNKCKHHRYKKFREIKFIINIEKKIVFNFTG